MNLRRRPLLQLEPVPGELEQPVPAGLPSASNIAEEPSVVNSSPRSPRIRSSSAFLFSDEHARRPVVAQVNEIEP